MNLRRPPALDSTEIDDVSAPRGLRTRRSRFVYHGHTIVLAGAGTVSFATPGLGADLGAWRKHLAELAALQTETFRFRLRLNPWTFCFTDDRAVPGPWARDADGYLLHAFNGRFWDLVRGVVELAHGHGMVVHLVLFDGRALDRGPNGGWDRHPFSRARGGPIAGAPTPAFYNLVEPRSFDLHALEPSDRLPEPKLTQCYQQRYVAHAINVLAGLDNVAWGIVSEIDGADPARVSFVQHYIEFLRRHDPLDRLVSCSGRNPLRSDSVYYHLTGIDSVQFHLDVPESQRRAPVLNAVRALRQFGKPVVLDTIRWPDRDPRTAIRQRTAFWRAFVSGGHASLHEGAWPGKHADAAWLRTHIRVVSSLDVASLYPVPSVVRSCDGRIWAEAAIGPREGIVYFVAGEPVPESRMALALPEGDWILQWIDPTSGRPIRETQERVSRAPIEVNAPAVACDLLLVLRRPPAASRPTT